MTVREFYRTYTSDCTAGCGNQLLAQLTQPLKKTGRCWFRLQHGGENYAMLFSNSIDSTFDDGSVSRANDVGGDWRIHSLRVGLCRTAGQEPETWYQITFDGSEEKEVSPGALFASDPVPLKAKAGAFLCYEITLTGSCFPYHEEAVLRMVPDKQIPLPLMIGCDRKVRERIGFLGDSITQGCGTEDDSYTHWVAKIADGLPEDCSVWNLGIGYARSSDAASCGGWLDRAKECDTVHVCFGVNDVLRGRRPEEVLRDLTIIIGKLKGAGCRVILLTVPPFDLEAELRLCWQQINAVIRSSLWKDADALFDIAAVLGKPAPNENYCVYGGHPNAAGCSAVASAYLNKFFY